MGQSVTVGIIGDGQLALMLAEALQKRKIDFYAWSESKESPMLTFFPDHVTNDIEKFRDRCSVFTLENEFHTTNELESILGEKAQNLFPDLSSYSHFADKISQRKFYEGCGLPSPQWTALNNESDLSRLDNFSYPLVVKASKGGYDGKGVRIVLNDSELQAALKEFNFHSGHALLIEEKVKIKKEVAMGFLRHKNGHSTLLPLVETVQENGVCNLVTFPCDVDKNIEDQIKNILTKMMNAGLAGIFNFEFFLDEKNNVLINEGAPRTHNSQHLTINASSFSQFDLLALYLSNPEEAPNEISTLPSAMVNVLGQINGVVGDLKIPEFPGLKLHPKMYGKKKSSPGRKLGHVNIVDIEGKSDLKLIGKKILQEYEL